jgi:hypothetical protein
MCLRLPGVIPAGAPLATWDSRQQVEARFRYLDTNPLYEHLARMNSYVGFVALACG